MKMLFGLSGRYIRSKGTVGWNEVLYALDRGWLSPRAVVEYAEALVEEGSDDSRVIELAGMFRGEEHGVRDIVEAMASHDGDVEDGSAVMKWMCIILGWVYRRQGDFPDPLGVVEELYAEFGYPQELEPFVRYMPVVDGVLEASTTQNEARMFEEWRRFVERCEGGLG
jgi:hypothetical protein